MTRVRIAPPDIEEDVSAEQVAAYLLRPGSGWTEAVNLSAHWRTFTMGLRAAHAPRSAFVNHRVAESIHDISRAEQRHPSAVLADIVGPVRAASVGARCATSGWRCAAVTMDGVKMTRAARGAGEESE